MFLKVVELESTDFWGEETEQWIQNSVLLVPMNILANLISIANDFQRSNSI